MVHCEDCRFFDRAGGYKGNLNDYGRCRFNPPAFVVIEGLDPKIGKWPETMTTDWCSRGDEKTYKLVFAWRGEDL